MKAFHHTTRNVGRNLVAQAVAQRVFKQAALDFQIRIHTLDDGDDASMEVAACITIFEVVLKLVYDPVIRGALSAAKSCLDRSCEWRTIDAVSLDQGLSRVLDIHPTLKASAINDAWHDVIKERA